MSEPKIDKTEYHWRSKKGPEANMIRKLLAELARLKNQTDEQAQTIDERDALLKREAGRYEREVQRWVVATEKAEAVVDKLPKTVDGVSMVPGIDLYYQKGIGEVVHIVPRLVGYTSVIASNGAGYGGERLYSTREAAEAARELLKPPTEPTDE